jgi:hypothetical protein
LFKHWQKTKQQRCEQLEKSEGKLEFVGRVGVGEQLEDKMLNAG